MTLLRRCSPLPLLLALLLPAAAAQAQDLISSPLRADPARAQLAATAAPVSARGTQALALPFFDDFTTPLEGLPAAQRWVPGGGVLVNNRFALAPPTRGVATFDAFKANGTTYSGQSSRTRFGVLDSLTSQPINLGGLAAADAVYLSFARQSGSIVGGSTPNSPGRPVNLRLYFKDNTGAWARVWADSSVANAAGTSTLTVFRQAVVAVAQPRFLHGDFQFRFVASGKSNELSDIWSIDYVVLDRGRTPADTTFTDVATSAGLPNRPAAGLTNPLRNYTSLPVWQYNAAPTPSAELNPQLGVLITNLNRSLLPISYQGTVRELNTNTAVGNWLNVNSIVFGTSPRQRPVVGDASQAAPPVSPGFKRLRYTLALNTDEQNSGTARTVPNDTIFRDVELRNYYAFDDGTPEAGAHITFSGPGPPVYLAYRCIANQTDRVSSIRMYPIFSAEDRPLSRPITINVWADVNGRPSSVALATKSVVVHDSLVNSQGYIDFQFTVPVQVNGVFYAGYGQTYSTLREANFFNYGVDKNTHRLPPQSLWRQTGGAWDTVRFLIPGALMMRVVMNNNTTSLATTAPEAAASFALYPNPGHGTVRVAGPAFRHATVLDALGRPVWEQPAPDAGRPELPLENLPAGLYLVRLTLPDGRQMHQRLILE